MEPSGAEGVRLGRRVFRISHQSGDQRGANRAKARLRNRRANLEQNGIGGDQHALFALRQNLQLQGIVVKRVALRELRYQIARIKKPHQRIGCSKLTE